MNVNDPIADMLTRIRNAQKAGHEVVSIPASKMKISLAQIFREEGLIRNFKCIRDNKQGILKIALKYSEKGHGAISELKRVSTVSRRYYVSHKEIPLVRSGFGISVISTSRGLMTDRKARELGVGGEIVCSAY